jgi:hypothetical protein
MRFAVLICVLLAATSTAARDVAGPHGEVLRPQWHEPDTLDRRHLL